MLPRMADLVEGSWYLLRLTAGRECKARDMIHDRLQLRVYVPLALDRRGILNCQLAPMFPGYGFLRTAAIEDHWGPVLSCPDVLGIETKEGVSGRAVIPDDLAVIPDDVIERCREQAREEDAKTLEIMADEGRRQRSKVRKGRRRVPPPPSNRRRIRRSALTPFHNEQDFGEVSLGRTMSPRGPINKLVRKLSLFRLRALRR